MAARFDTPSVHLYERFVRVVDGRTGEVIEVRLADEEGNGTALDVALALVPHFELWIDVARMNDQSLDVRLSPSDERQVS